MNCRIDFAKLTISKASVGDAGEVISLLDAAAEWIQDRGIDQWRPGSFNKERLLTRIRNGEVYIATYEGSIVGTFRLQMHDKSVWGERDSNEDYAYIHRLAIKSDFHGQRLGLYLLEQAKNSVVFDKRVPVWIACWKLRVESYYENIAGYKPVGSATPLGYSARLFEKKFAR